MHGSLLYGTTFTGGPNSGGTAFQIDVATGQETTLHSFPATGTDGNSPSGSLVRAPGGNLFGVTSAGGAGGFGTVYEIDSAGGETVLYSFTGQADGELPYGALAMGGENVLYGTTNYSGVSPYGGTAYALHGASMHTLYTFGSGKDGFSPAGGLLLQNGFAFGATQNGGTDGYGVVYQLDSSAVETVLYNFTGGPDGAGPTTLVSDANGNLYGTTNAGGIQSRCGNDGVNGCGVVFELNIASQIETVLHTFSGGKDGSVPNAGLIRDSLGNLYGTTVYGGASGFGTVFKLDPSGNFTTLYSFKGGDDGALPFGGLVESSQGHLFGVATYGGSAGNGTVFEVVP